MQRTFPAWHLESFQAVFPPRIISWDHLNHQVLMRCIKMLFGQGRFAIVSQAVWASHLPRMDLPGSFAPFIKIWKLREGQGQGQGGFLGRLWVPPKSLLCAFAKSEGIVSLGLDESLPSGLAAQAGGGTWAVWRLCPAAHTAQPSFPFCYVQLWKKSYGDQGIIYPKTSFKNEKMKRKRLVKFSYIPATALSSESLLKPRNFEAWTPTGMHKWLHTWEELASEWRDGPASAHLTLMQKTWVLF